VVRVAAQLRCVRANYPSLLQQWPLPPTSADIIQDRAMHCRRPFTVVLGVLAMTSAACAYGSVLAPIDCVPVTVEPLRDDVREPLDERAGPASSATSAGQGDPCDSSTQASRSSARLAHLTAEAAVEARDQRNAVAGALLLSGTVSLLAGVYEPGEPVGVALIGVGATLIGAGIWRLVETTGLEDLDATWRRQQLETASSATATLIEREAALAALADSDLTVRNIAGSTLVVVGGGFIAASIWEATRPRDPEVGRVGVGKQIGQGIKVVLVGVAGSLMVAGGVGILATPSRAERLWEQWHDVERLSALTLQPGAAVYQDGFIVSLGSSF